MSPITRKGKRTHSETTGEGEKKEQQKETTEEPEPTTIDPPLETQPPETEDEEMQDASQPEEEEGATDPPQDTTIMGGYDPVAAAAHAAAAYPQDTMTEHKMEGNDGRPPLFLPEFASEFDEGEVEEKSSKIRERMLYDVIDYQYEVILRLQSVERRNRPLHYNAVQEIAEMYPHKNQQFGRLYIRSLMCKLLHDVFPQGLMSNLPEMTNDLQWHTLKADLQYLHNLCIRKDSNASSPGSDKPSARINVERQQEPHFDRRFKKVITFLEVGRIFQSFKVSGLLMNVFDGSEANFEVDQALVDQAMERINNSNDDQAKPVLLKLFETDGKSTAGPAKLKSLSDLSVAITSVKAFDLNWVASKLEKLIKLWNESLYGGKKAKLFLLKYNLTPKLKAQAIQPKKTKTSLRRQTTAAIISETLNGLAENRVSLRDNHGEDPLEESRALALEATEEAPATKRVKTEDDNVDDSTAAHEAAAAAVAAAISQDTDKEPQSIVDLFEDSSDEEKEDEYAKPRPAPDKIIAFTPVLQLGEGGPPPSTSVSDANNPFYIGPQPDPGVFDDRGNVMIKRPWTEEETDALMSGIRTFGPGKWVQIKNLYGDMFRNRSSVMLKDKYRNLRRQGKLPDDLVIASV